MTRTTHPRLTPPRLAVLQYLRDHPGHNPIGYGGAVPACMRLGWVEMARNAANQVIGPILTEAGRAMLTANTNPVGILALPPRTPAVASMPRSGIEETHE